MKRMIVFLCCVSWLAACKDKSVPKNVLQPAQMSDLLWDMTLAEEYIFTKAVKDTNMNKNQEIQKEYQQIFQSYRISRDQFQKSYRYYNTHPEHFKVVMDTVSARAQRKRDNLHSPLSPKLTPMPSRPRIVR